MDKGPMSSFDIFSMTILHLNCTLFQPFTGIHRVRLFSKVSRCRIDVRAASCCHQISPDRFSARSFSSQGCIYQRRSTRYLWNISEIYSNWVLCAVKMQNCLVFLVLGIYFERIFQNQININLQYLKNTKYVQNIFG